MSKEKTIKELEATRIHVELVGTSDLILNKKALSFEREEIYKQSHPRGTSIPKELDARLHYNLWEKLCTSIHWEKPMPVYDHYEDYTEETWKDLMENNRPCIMSKAFTAGFYEAFVSFGYKETTNRNGTDFKRTVSMTDPMHPVNFAQATYSQHLTPNNTVSKTNVLAQYNIFKGWSCDLDLFFIPKVFPLETIVEIISTTGKFIGVGTKRAEGYGHYEIGKVDVYQKA